jgi:hypothetical protein
MIISDRRREKVDRRKALIEAATVRVLSLDEEAELAFLWWNGSPAKFVETLSAAYATAKKYERFGGGDLREKLDEFQRKLNSSDFSVLYRAKKLFCGE